MTGLPAACAQIHWTARVQDTDLWQKFIGRPSSRPGMGPGPYPAICKTKWWVNKAAAKCFADAQAMLQKNHGGRWLTANGAGYLPCQYGQ